MICVPVWTSSMGLNPYSNGIRIEPDGVNLNVSGGECLNPYSNGIRIERRSQRTLSRR